MVWNLQKAAAECRCLAAEFKRKAQKTWLPSTRRYYLEMAENWLALAQNYEFHLNLRRNIGELDEGALRSMAPYQISVRTAEGALGVIANVRQHTGVVLAHDPLRHW